MCILSTDRIICSLYGVTTGYRIINWSTESCSAVVGHLHVLLSVTESHASAMWKSSRQTAVSVLLNHMTKNTVALAVFVTFFWLYVSPSCFLSLFLSLKDCSYIFVFCSTFVTVKYYSEKRIVILRQWHWEYKLFADMKGWCKDVHADILAHWHKLLYLLTVPVCNAFFYYF